MSTKRKRFVLVGIFAAVALGVGIPTVLASGGGSGDIKSAANIGVGPAVGGPSDATTACDLSHSVIYHGERAGGSPDTTASTSFGPVPSTSVSFTLPSHPKKPHDPHPPAPWQYCAIVHFSAELQGPPGVAATQFEAKLDGSTPTEFVQYDGNGTLATTHEFTFVFPSILEGSHTIKILWRSVPAVLSAIWDRTLVLSYSDAL